MHTTKTHLMETGLTPGTTLVAADIGFDTLNKGTGSNIVNTTTAPIGGAESVLVTQGSGAASQMFDTIGSPVDMQAACSYRVTFAGTFTVLSEIAGIRNSAGKVVNMFRDLTNALRFYDNGNTLRYTTPAAYVDGDRVEVHVVVGTTTSNGRFRVRIYQGDTNTLRHPEYDSGTTINTGTTPIASMRYGRPSGTADVTSSKWDNIVSAFGASDFVGPAVVPNVGPSAVPAPDLTGIEAGTTQTTSVAATDADGTIASYTASCATLTLTGTGNSRTTGRIPAPLVETTHDILWTVTDDDGASTQVHHYITVLPAPRRIRIGGVLKGIYKRRKL